MRETKTVKKTAIKASERNIFIDGLWVKKKMEGEITHLFSAPLRLCVIFCRVPTMFTPRRKGTGKSNCELFFEVEVEGCGLLGRSVLFIERDFVGQHRLSGGDFRAYNLELDVCDQRHGFWLDEGEAVRVREIVEERVAGLERAAKAEGDWDRFLGDLKKGPSFWDRLTGH